MGQKSSKISETLKNEKIRQLFKQMDTDKDKELNPQEVRALIKALKMESTYCDSLSDEKLDFDDFKRCLARFMKTVFNDLDEDNDGFLTFNDLEKAKRASRDDTTIDNLRKILIFSDFNEESKISYLGFYITFLDILKEKVKEIMDS